MPITNFKDLVVWQKGMLLVREVYTITNALPRNEVYILAAQIIRAAVSVPSNIAEGFKRNGRAEFKQFLKIADASAAEVETQLLIIKMIYPQIDTTSALSLTTEVQKMLNKLISGIH